MSTLTWLHLSDLHMRRDALDDMYVVLDALWRDLPEQIEKLGGQLDFIAFTGDVAFSGKKEEYKLAEKHFFKPLLATTAVSKERLFVVPGNHDVDRELTKLINPEIVSSLKSRDQVAALLRDDAQRRMLLQPTTEYTQFVRRLLGKSSRRQICRDPVYAYAELLSLTTPAVSMIGVNSTWASGFTKDLHGNVMDHGNLLIGDKQIGDALRQTEETAVRIALMHHPVGWLREFDGLDVQRGLQSRCHFVLHGHLHVPDFRIEKALGGDTITIPAGTVYKTREWLNGYNLVELDFATGNGKIALRRYSEDRHEWVKDVLSTGDKLDGEVEFDIPGLLVPSVPEPSRPISLARQVLLEIEPCWLGLGRDRETQLLETFLERDDRSTLWVFGDRGCGVSEFLLIAEQLLRHKDAEIIRFDAEDMACGIPVDQDYFLDRLEHWVDTTLKEVHRHNSDESDDRLQNLTRNIADCLMRTEKPLVLIFASFHLLLPTIREWLLSSLWGQMSEQLQQYRPIAIFACEGSLPACPGSLQQNKILLSDFTVFDVERFLNTVPSLDDSEIPSLARTIHSPDSDEFQVSPTRVYQNLIAEMVRREFGGRYW